MHYTRNMSIRKNIDKLLRKLEKEYLAHNRIEVSRSAIVHNLHFFKQLTGQQIIPVLKGNAYGHGIQLITAAVKSEKIPYVAVDGYFEACRIREVSKQPVLIMGAIQPENFPHLNYDDFTFVVHDIASIQALGNTKKNVKIHLECNTGMNRYGAEPEQLAELTRLILTYNNLTLEGVMSHLADSDGNNPETVSAAVSTFDACVEAVRAAGANPTMIHIAQTAGSLKARSKYANTIRLGVGLYGINPFPKTHKLHNSLSSLHPALRLISTITQVTNLEKGDSVSYNYTFTAPRAMQIGVLPLGYYEGVNRSLSSKGSQPPIISSTTIYSPLLVQTFDEF